MADIQFQEPQYGRSLPGAARDSWLTALIIKTGLAKDSASAQKVLLIILVLAVAGIIAIWTLGGSSTPSVPPPPAP